MHQKFQHIFWGVLFLVLGLLITLQIKSVQEEAAIERKHKDPVSLHEALKQQKERSAQLQKDLSKYEAQIAEYEAKLPKNQETERMKAQLNEAKIAAGLTDSTAPGVIITLNDSTDKMEGGMSAKDFVIHDADVLSLINLLRTSGAQAISINNERLVSISETQCAGPTISVNHNRYAVPFVVKAIGNPDYLNAKLNEITIGNPVSYMRMRGIGIDIKKDNKVNIPKFSGSLSREGNIIEVGANK